MGNISCAASISPQHRAYAQDLLDFIDASPSPWHAVDTCQQRLLAHGFHQLHENAAWQLIPGQAYFVIRGGSSIIAFRLGTAPLAENGLRIIGAHTDSPGLRLKPKAAHSSEGIARLGVEVYGGPILATFADRDLSLAGRVTLRNAQLASQPGFSSRLLKFEQVLLRLPNLAIHMNREVNDKGLKFNKQTELPLLLGTEALTQAQPFMQLIAAKLQVAEQDVLSWELNAYDTQKGVFWGAQQEFIADSQLDNLASCHAALTALLATEPTTTTSMCAFFDHEEVGSESASGAGGSFIGDVLQRLHANAGEHAAGQVNVQQDYLRMLANSFFISADMAHAYHPNFPAAYEPQHHAMVNQGPVIKTNANQRYSTGADTAARFILLCEAAGVPYQQYAHRSDLGCGSTIGPIVASQLGVASVDVGAPMWAMHSIRESAGVLDHGYMIEVMRAMFTH